MEWVGELVCVFRLLVLPPWMEQTFTSWLPSPDEHRHDVYLTMLHGVFNKGTKRADKNVQIDVEVIDEKEQLIPV